MTYPAFLCKKTDDQWSPLRVFYIMAECRGCRPLKILSKNEITPGDRCFFTHLFKVRGVISVRSCYLTSFVILSFYRMDILHFSEFIGHLLLFFHSFLSISSMPDASLMKNFGLFITAKIF